MTDNSMQQISRFTLVELSTWHPFREYKRRLAMNGHPLPVVVQGDEIAAQFEYGGMSVIVTHYDYFDGVSYWFHLLNSDGSVKDIVSTPNYFGFIENLESTAAHEIQFGFHGTHDRWLLRIQETGFRSFRRMQLHQRLNRFIFRKRYLVLECTRGPVWISPGNTRAQ